MFSQFSIQLLHSFKHQLANSGLFAKSTDKQILPDSLTLTQSRDFCSRRGDLRAGADGVLLQAVLLAAVDRRSGKVISLQSLTLSDLQTLYTKQHNKTAQPKADKCPASNFSQFNCCLSVYTYIYISIYLYDAVGFLNTVHQTT